MINESRRPVIYFGGGVVTSGASKELHALMAKANIPACHTMMGTGILGYKEELNLGMIGMHGCASSSEAVVNADALIVLGARFSDRGASMKSNVKESTDIIHIDIDAAEINKNVTADYSVVGDVKEVLQQLLPLIQPREHRNWINQINQWRQNMDYRPQDSHTVIKPHQLIQAISNVLGEDGIITTDVGQHQMWAVQYLGRIKQRSFLSSGGLGTMGFGYGAAIGAKVAFPNRPVVHITGDGSFHMNLNEMCTSVSYDIPIITVVMNNNVLGMIRQWQTTFYQKKYISSDLYRKTDYVKLAEAFGGVGFRCSSVAEFEQTLAKAIALNRTCVIECPIDKDEKVLPMIPAGGTVDNIILE